VEEAVNTQQIVNRVISAATWQLMRRSPTWLLLAIVGGALLYSLLFRV
jgi:hypothetical protein